MKKNLCLLSLGMMVFSAEAAPRDRADLERHLAAAQNTERKNADMELFNRHVRNGRAKKAFDILIKYKDDPDLKI